jgi:hypothetical protein
MDLSECFVILLVLLGIKGQLLGDVESETCSVSDCVNNILAKYYHPGILIVLVDTPDVHISYPIIRQISTTQDFKIFDYQLPQIYVVTLRENLGKVLDSLQKIETFNSRARFIIILKGSIPTVQIFQDLARYFIYNAVVLDQNENLVTYDPFVYENVVPDGVEPKVLGRCDGSPLGELFNKTFPKYWRNTTVVSAYTKHFPYLFRNGSIEGENYEFVKMIEDHLQFTLILEEKNINGSDLLGLFLPFSLDKICIRSLAEKNHLYGGKPSNHQHL